MDLEVEGTWKPLNDQPWYVRWLVLLFGRVDGGGQSYTWFTFRGCSYFYERQKGE